MKYKTLILNKDTELQEYYGCINFNGNLEWFSSETPINIMNEALTLEDIKKKYPEKDFTNIELVTIDIKIIK